MKFVDDDDDDQ